MKEKVSLAPSVMQITMKHLFFLYFILLIVSTNQVQAQTSVGKLMSAAEKSKKKLNYSPALKAYKEVLSIDSDNSKAYRGLVEIYLYGYEIYDSAFTYLTKEIAQMEDTNYVVFYDYANCLRLQEKHNEAIEWYNFLIKKAVKRKTKDNPFFVSINFNIKSCQNALNNMELIYEPLEVENMDFFINSVDAEYTPVFIQPWH
jgi:tetratricopeptide (TPR) repeat protein